MFLAILAENVKDPHHVLPVLSCLQDEHTRVYVKDGPMFDFLSDDAMKMKSNLAEKKDVELFQCYTYPELIDIQGGRVEVRLTVISMMVAAKSKKLNCGTGRLLSFERYKRTVGTHYDFHLTNAKDCLHFNNDYEQLLKFVLFGMRINTDVRSVVQIVEITWGVVKRCHVFAVHVRV